MTRIKHTIIWCTAVDFGVKKDNYVKVCKYSVYEWYYILQTPRFTDSHGLSYLFTISFPLKHLQVLGVSWRFVFEYPEESKYSDRRLIGSFLPDIYLRLKSNIQNNLTDRE